MKHILKYIIAPLFIILSLVSIGYAQDDCLLKLQDAQKLYDEGKIEQIPDLLNPCIKNGFNRENKIQALRLLALVYLFEDKHEEAEEALLQILKMDPEYKVNKSVDAVDYIRLYKLFNTDPIFSVGIMGGFNNTYPMLIEPIGTNSFDSINANYSSDGIAFCIGLRATYHWDTKLEITFEPSYLINAKFSFSEDVSSYEYNTGSEQANYINFPLLVNYNFYELKQSKFYAELGFCYGLFVGGSQELTSSFVDNTNPSSPTPSFSTNDIREKNNYAGIIGLGSKVNLDRSFLQLGLRYSYGFNNVVKDDLVNNATTNTAQWTNRHIDNQLRMTNLIFTISYNYEFYKHKR